MRGADCFDLERMLETLTACFILVRTFLIPSWSVEVIFAGFIAPLGSSPSILEANVQRPPIIALSTNSSSHLQLAILNFRPSSKPKTHT